MFILLNKKNMKSLCLELLQFVLLILITPPPFIFTQPLVIYWYVCKIITFKPWSYLRGTGQNTHTFFQNKNYFTKILPILFAKMAFNKKKILFKHV